MGFNSGFKGLTVIWSFEGICCNWLFLWFHYGRQKKRCQWYVYAKTDGL